MPIYNYYPANDSNGSPSYLEIVGKDPADIDRIKQQLIRRVMRLTLEDLEAPLADDDAFKTIDALSDYAQNLRQAPSGEILCDILTTKALVLDPEAVVLDAASGLVAGVDENDQWVPYVTSINKDSMRQITANRQIHKHVRQVGVNSFGVTVEPKPNPLTGMDYTPHITLGHMTEQLEFRPLITVLGESHPVVQALSSYDNVFLMSDYNSRAA